MSGTSFICLSLQYLKFSPGSAWTNKGFKSRSSKLDAPLLTWDNKSVLPMISFTDLNPREASISLTSVATKVNKLTTFSGVPLNFSLKALSWLQTPTGQVF